MIYKTTDNRIAVYANDLCFSYFNSDSILKEIKLNVNKANIYGLLGPSGCGKTTLLKCILGRLKPSRGEIQIFGAKPSSPECHIPGAGVGYMPQEMGLCSVFTVEEILTYFGKIYSMNKNEIKEKYTQLMELLNLPKDDKLIDEFSGGQKWRISLACALIHSPPLLILDEPTVGTDPKIRKTIWLHLRTLCESGHTIILTTHYIEEARNANVVAFMRDGSILAEDEPNILLNNYMSTTLEEVFLKLCDSETNGSNNSNVIEVQNQSYGNEIIDNINKNDGKYVTTVTLASDVKRTGSINNNLTLNQCSIKYDGKPSDPFSKQLKSPQFIPKCTALLQKNYKRVTRNWIQLIFFILFPTIEFGLLLYSIGDRPSNLNLAVFDEEFQNNVTHGWGHLFVESIDNKTFNKILFDSFEEALSSVKRGETYAVIDINERFSKALRLRSFYGSDADNETIDESVIKVHIDWTNQLVGLQIERYLYEAMATFAKEVAIRVNTNPESIKIPLEFMEAVYGTRSSSLRDFVLPGSLIVIVFFACAVVSSNMILEERKDGILERSLVSGVTAFDFLLSHVLTQFSILCLQLVLMLSILPFLLSRGITSSFIVLIVLVVSQGGCGISFGLMVSAICSELLYAAMFITSSLMITIVLSGVFWPIENMPALLQFCGQLTPNTIPIHSLRNILYREWTLSHFEVYMGFVVTYVWLAFFLIIALILMKKCY